jgi:hypothetical protein
MENAKDKEALRACLAEYSALRDEILLTLRWRQNLMFASVASAGALFSFALADPAAGQSGAPSKALALYLIAPICSLSGLLWVDASWSMYRASFYIGEVLSAKVNSMISGMGVRGSGDRVLPGVLGWENSTHRNMRGPGTRFLQILGYVGSFVGPGVISQVLILTGSGRYPFGRAPKLDIPVVYLLNWAFIVAAFGVAAAGYVVKTRRSFYANKHWLSQ